MFKGMHSTVQTEIIEIDSIYPADLKTCWELILVALIFFYDEEAWCTFFFYLSTLFKSTLRVLYKQHEVAPNTF